MTHLGLIILIIIAFEMLRLFKFIPLFKKNISLYKKIFKLLNFKNASDNWKEKALLNYSKNLFLTSIKIILILSLIIFLFLILNFLDKNFYKFILSLYGLVEATILFLIYTYLRKYFHAKL